MNNNKSMYWDLGVIFFTTLIVFFMIPLYMIVLSPLDYALIDKVSLIKVGIILASLYFIIYTFLYWILCFLKLNKIASFLTFFIFYWILLSGYLFPLIQKSGMQDPLNMANNKINFILVLLLSIFFSVLIKTKFNKGIIVFTSVFTVLSFSSTFYDAYSLYNVKDKAKNFTKFSPLNNVIVLSLDGIPGQIAYNIINENPQLRDQFKDFILFENVISSSPATMASITGELFGNQDFKKIGSTQEKLYKNLDKNLLLINQKGIDAYTYYAYNSYNIHPETQVNIGELSKNFSSDLSQTDFLIDFYRYVTVRLGTNRLLRILEYIGNDTLNFNSNFITLLISSKTNSTELTQRLKNHKGPNWSKESVISILDFDYMTNNLSLGTSRNTVRYMHFIFTHYPNSFDEHCNYMADKQAWYDLNQNEKGIVNETKCALNKLSSFVSKLKELGIYDKTLIILKSDHGKPVNYFSSPPNNYKINNHPLWGYNRYHPMLLIKNFNQNKTKLEINNNLVSLNDLATSICRTVDQNNQCDVFPGMNIFNEILPDPRELYIFVPKNELSDYTFDSHKTVLIKGNSFLQMLQNNPNIEIEEAGKL